MNEIVKIHNDLTNEKLGKMNAKELDLFMCICYKMRDKGLENVIIPFSELRELSAYKTKNSNKDLISELTKANSKLLEFQFIVEKGYKLYHRTLFKEFITDTKECTLTVSVWEETRYILNDISNNFTRFELNEFIKLESKYSKRLYKLLKQFRTKGYYYTSKESFYKDLDIPESYTNADFNRRALKPAVEECQKFIKGLRYEAVKTGRGNAVKAYMFHFDAEKATPEKQQPKDKAKTNKFDFEQKQDYNFDDLEKSLLNN